MMLGPEDKCLPSSPPTQLLSLACSAGISLGRVSVKRLAIIIQQAMFDLEFSLLWTIAHPLGKYCTNISI